MAMNGTAAGAAPVGPQAEASPVGRTATAKVGGGKAPATKLGTIVILHLGNLGMTAAVAGMAMSRGSQAEEKVNRMTLGFQSKPAPRANAEEEAKRISATILPQLVTY